MKDILIFFYNFKKKAIAVVNRESYRCMRGNSLATHGLGHGSVYRIYDRNLTEMERPYYSSLTRAKVFFYDNILDLIKEEEKAQVPINQIEELKKACIGLEFVLHYPELNFIE